jgi:lipase chaperone LimK
LFIIGFFRKFSDFVFKRAAAGADFKRKYWSGRHQSERKFAADCFESRREAKFDASGKYKQFKFRRFNCADDDRQRDRD